MCIKYSWGLCSLAYSKNVLVLSVLKFYPKCKSNSHFLPSCLVDFPQPFQATENTPSSLWGIYYVSYSLEFLRFSKKKSVFKLLSSSLLFSIHKFDLLESLLVSGWDCKSTCSSKGPGPCMFISLWSEGHLSFCFDLWTWLCKSWSWGMLNKSCFIFF